MENTTIKVLGMSCQGCVRNVTDVLRATPGVGAAEVSLADEAATVSFDPALATREQLLAVIEDAGFDAS